MGGNGRAAPNEDYKSGDTSLNPLSTHRLATVDVQHAHSSDFLTLNASTSQPCLICGVTNPQSSEWV